MTLVAIVGPTSAGKSALALRLAAMFSGEIINADSRQVYRYLDIGTDKPSLEDRARIAHHLLDVVDPEQEFSLAHYKSLASQAIEDVRSRGKVPLLVGGSGLYVWSVLEGWELPNVPPNPGLRDELAAQAAQEGQAAVYARLVALDPDAARRIDARNVRRVIRALEVCHSGTRFSQAGRRNEVAFREGPVVLGLTAPRDELYGRIDSRVDSMFERGLVEEVWELRRRGYGAALPSMSSIGYRQVGMYLDGSVGLSEAVQQTKFETHRFARHQYAWFRRGDERIHWLEGAGVEEMAEDWLGGVLHRKDKNEVP